MWPPFLPKDSTFGHIMSSPRALAEESGSIEADETWASDRPSQGIINIMPQSLDYVNGFPIPSV